MKGSPGGARLLRRRFVKTITRCPGCQRAGDHPAPDHEVPLVPHDRLTGRDGALRLVEDDRSRAVGLGPYGRGCRDMTVPDARLDPDGLGWRVSGDEVDVRGDETIALEVGGG